jgi:hypothetical protein
MGALNHGQEQALKSDRLLVDVRLPKGLFATFFKSPLTDLFPEDLLGHSASMNLRS